MERLATLYYTTCAFLHLIKHCSVWSVGSALDEPAGCDPQTVEVSSSPPTGVVRNPQRGLHLILKKRGVILSVQPFWNSLPSPSRPNEDWVSVGKRFTNLIAGTVARLDISGRIDWRNTVCSVICLVLLMFLSLNMPTLPCENTEDGGRGERRKA